MSERVKCKRCSGSGEAFGGVCYGCNGTGEVDDMAYRTVSASESKLPAMIADRQEKPREKRWSPPEIAEPEFAKCWALLAQDGEALDAEPSPEPVTQWNCEHEFKAYNYRPMCRLCGMFESQFMEAMAWTPRVERLQ